MSRCEINDDDTGKALKECAKVLLQKRRLLEITKQKTTEQLIDDNALFAVFAGKCYFGSVKIQKRLLLRCINHF